MTVLNENAETILHIHERQDFSRPESLQRSIILLFCFNSWGGECLMVGRNLMWGGGGHIPLLEGPT